MDLLDILLDHFLGQSGGHFWTDYCQLCDQRQFFAKSSRRTFKEILNMSPILFFALLRNLTNSIDSVWTDCPCRLSCSLLYSALFSNHLSSYSLCKTIRLMWPLPPFHYERDSSFICCHLPLRSSFYRPIYSKTIIDTFDNILLNLHFFDLYYAAHLSNFLWRQSSSKNKETPIKMKNNKSDWAGTDLDSI